MVEACEKNDFAASTRTFLFFWGVPIAAIVLASFLTPPTSILVRASALFWAGAACAVNAYRCGRLHCYITGPLLLLGGLAILLAGFADVAIPTTWILTAVGAGTCLAFCLERHFGAKYVRKQQDT